MKSLVLLALVTGVASASERYPLFPDHHVPDEAALRSAEAVGKACAYSEMSRIGPNPDEVARCDAAEHALLAFGPRAVPAVMQTLDSPSLRFMAMGYLYDVLARVGDASTVEPLVAALEREEAQGLGNPRQSDRGYLARTLERITHVKLKGTPAIEWRQWADAHRARETRTAKADGKPTS